MFQITKEFVMCAKAPLTNKMNYAELGRFMQCLSVFAQDRQLCAHIIA